MRRRDFITVVGSAAAAWPLAARGQQPTGRIARIAYLGALSPATLDPRQSEQFKAGLTENGLVEGQNITVDYLWGEGNSERLRQLCAAKSGCDRHGQAATDAGAVGNQNNNSNRVRHPQ